MKACNPPGLAEAFIISIAREVAIALKYVHDAGIVHRDIKCANILVTEDGRIQLCDFGISGVLENQVSKRTTIIGTPHWMAPEIVGHLGSEFPGVSYGAEIDCWAYGCMVFEMATGRPPNSNVPPHKLGITLNLRAPRLDTTKYPEGLCDFTAFCLEQQPEQRPNATQIMSHPYISNTEDQYPASRITKLIENFAMWEQEGGQRSSLFDPNLGAQGPDELSSIGSEEEWNFSTTADFDRRISMRFDDAFDINNVAAMGAPGQGAFNFMEEQRSKRGEAALNRVFDQSARPYAYGERRGSDLPLRDYQDLSTGNRETMINLDDIGMPDFNLPNLSLLDPPTLRPNRKRIDSDTSSDGAPFQTARRTTQDWSSRNSQASSREQSEERKPRPPTMAWSFAAAQQEAGGDIPDTSDVITPPAQIHETARKSTLKPSAKRGTMAWSFADAQSEANTMKSNHHMSFTADDAIIDPPRPSLKHSATMPVGSAFPSVTASSPERASMINLDDALELTIPELSRRPSVAHSATDSAVTDMTQGDPFDLEEQLELSKEASRTSLHLKTQSEPTLGFLEGKGKMDDSSSLYGSDIDMAMHNRSSSLNQQSDRSDRDRSTSRPPGGAAAGRYRPRKPTALQRHLADRARLPNSSDSTVPSSRGGSFDSTGSTVPMPAGHNHNLSFGASDEEMRREDTKLWSRVRAQHRRPNISDGASTIASNASRSDSEGITMKASARPSRLVGNWKPSKGLDGYILPYDADTKLLLPDPPQDLATREFSRLWFTLQAMSSQNAEVLEKEYGAPIDDAELEAEFGPRQLWRAAGVGKMSAIGSGDENDGMRFNEASALRGNF